ncbi:MAG TPA: hypothetical protein VH643_39930 [Gemmataceae bacterium]
MTIPRPHWFWMQPPSHLHGRGHTTRVMVWAAVLTRGTEWFEPVVWAAACHDLRRQDDGADPEHGFRAGAWVRTRLQQMLPEPPADLELIANACDWHVCPDRRSQWDHPTLWLLKDADGLDRVRLGDLDKRFLRHEEARRRVGDAQRLFDATVRTQGPKEILQAAQRLRLPVGELLAWVDRQVKNASQA